MKKVVYLESFRMASWWIHLRDLDWPSPDVLDNIRRRADAMAADNVNCAVVFGAHFRWDFMPYWTLLHSYLAEVAQELHARKIRLFDHHSAVLVHRYQSREELRNVMLHSRPHLPLAPDRRSADRWEFAGQRLNNWRMMDIPTGNVLYLPQYTAEEFCFNRPDFKEAYGEYLKLLLAESGIDGLMCDDAAHFMGYRSCGCDFCRKTFQEKTGHPLPEWNDFHFWGNWESDEWKAWIDSRYAANGNFLKHVKECLPPEFPLMSCCSGSSKAFYNNSALDVRQYLQGCNLVHQELCGNTPPCEGVSGTGNPAMGERITLAAHHRAAASAAGVRCVGQGYGFTEASGEIIWALNKANGANCWFSTLKDRLGLPDSILEKLPGDSEAVGKVFGFEKRHPELFETKVLERFAVLFPYTARNHTAFGNHVNGCERDFRETMEEFYRAGFAPGVALSIPERPSESTPILLLPSAAALEAEEKNALVRYLDNGGFVLATGYLDFPGARTAQKMRIGESFWNFDWMNAPIPANGTGEWVELRRNFWWNPRRLQDGLPFAELAERVAGKQKKIPFEIRNPAGYFCLIHFSQERYILHFLAERYKVVLDEELEAQRFHRSRVNLIRKASPIQVERVLRIAGNWKIRAFAPLNSHAPQISSEEGCVIFPRECSYVIVELMRNTKGKE